MIKGEAHQKHVPHTKVEKPCCHMPQGGLLFCFVFFKFPPDFNVLTFLVFDVFLSFFLFG
jgi:hypothetical protein